MTRVNQVRQSDPGSASQAGMLSLNYPVSSCERLLTSLWLCQSLDLGKLRNGNDYFGYALYLHLIKPVHRWTVKKQPLISISREIEGKANRECAEDRFAKGRIICSRRAEAVARLGERKWGVSGVFGSTRWWPAVTNISWTVNELRFRLIRL